MKPNGIKTAPLVLRGGTSRAVPTAAKRKSPPHLWSRWSEDDTRSLQRKPVRTSHETASPFWTIPELATQWRCSRRHIERLLRDKKLPKNKNGRRTLIRKSDASKYAQKMREK